MSTLALQRARQFQIGARRAFTTSSQQQQQKINVHDLLTRPTWSVSSLLPKTSVSASTDSTTQITPTQLRHLLKLSALPPPKTPNEEQKMLTTLSSQLHFVQEIQKADTSGVKPLQSLRDETAAGEREAELGMEALKEAMAAEEVRGRFHRRVRRRREGKGSGEEGWDVLATAGKRTGRFFVVEGGKGS